MTEKKNFDEFKQLLRECIGSRSQKEFAKVSGISQEHISRMLKDEPISRPSKGTLSKILAASMSEHVTYSKLFESCGYEPKDSVATVRYERNKLDLYHQMKSVSNDIQVGFRSMIDTFKIFNSLGDAVKLFLDMHNVNIEKISLYDGARKSNCMDKVGDYYICGKAEWSSMKNDTVKNVIESYFILFFVQTDRGNFILTDVATDGATLNACDAIPPAFIDSLYEDGCNIDMLDFFAIVSEAPYERPEKINNLLKAIFGDDADNENSRKMGHVTFGFGFSYKETPRDFIPFLLNHKDSFCKSEEETELFEEFEEQVALNREFDVDAYFSNYFHECAKGTVAVVFAIMQRECADSNIGISYGESEKYEDILPPCIYVDELELCDKKGQMNTHLKDNVDCLLLSYAKELHMPTYGSTIVYHVYDVNVTDLQDEIQYDD